MSEPKFTTDMKFIFEEMHPDELWKGIEAYQPPEGIKMDDIIKEAELLNDKPSEKEEVL